MFNNFLCMDSFIVGFLIFDAVLLLTAVGVFIAYSVKNKKKKNGVNVNSVNPEMIDDETYVFEGEKPEEQLPPVEEDNAVVHFVNQITDINEEVNNELTSNAVIVNHEVEQPTKKTVRKEEIANFVVIDGKTKEKVEPKKTLNHGTNAFKNATNFLNTIKTEQNEVVDKKNSKKK